MNSAFCESSLDNLIQHNKSSYAEEKENWTCHSYYEYLNFLISSQEQLSPLKKCTAAWDIFKNQYEKAPKADFSVVGDDILTWQNLQLICGEQGKNRSSYLARHVDRTSTEVGRATLCAWVAQPIDDSEELVRRQSCVKALVENNALFNELDSYFSDFKKSENFLLSFWLDDPFKYMASPRPPSGKNLIEIPYLEEISEKMNQSVPLLTVSSLLEHTYNICNCGLTGISAVVLPVWGSLQVASWLSGTSLIPQSIDEKISSQVVSTGGALYAAASYVVKDKRLKYLLAAFAGAQALLRTRFAFDRTRDTFTLSNCLQKKLHHVCRCIQSIERMTNLIHENPQLTFSSAVKPLEALMQQFKAVNSATYELYALLMTPTFEGEPSVIAKYGAIIRAYRLVHEQLKELEPLLCSLGELDVYMSTARLYKEHEDKRVRYCFVQYKVGAEEPLIMFKDLWSTFIDRERVVSNSIELGISKGANNLIITGPNEGGKSTFVKAMAASLVLAQSIGVVPAAEAVLTPFSYLATYLNVADGQNISLFEAQVQRIKYILDHIDAMEITKHAFVVVDELFNGTEAAIGQAASCSIADYLSKKNQVISVFPTHFPQLTTLGGNGRSVNYRVSAHTTEQGVIKYPYTIEKGISSQNVVFSILQNEGFSPTILNGTKLFLNTSAYIA